MKAIFFDIDGTLIDNATKQIRESTVTAIALARENGHLCFVNTGRTRRLIERELTDRVAFDGYLLGCGTMIVYRNEILFHKSLSPELSKRVLDALSRYRIDALLEGAEENFCREREAMYSQVFRQYAEGYRDRNYPDFTDAAGRFDKLFAHAGEDGDMEAFQREFQEELSFIDRGGGFYEILSRGYSKATAIRYIADKLRISMEDTVAIGDSNNDLPMLECVHTSIAMGNSSDAVLAMADHVTGNADGDGIWEALSWLGVLEREERRL